MIDKFIKLAKIDENIIEIVAINDRVKIGRILKINNEYMIDIDVVEPINVYNIANILNRITIDNREILNVKLGDIDNMEIQGLIYKYDDKAELISIKILHVYHINEKDIVSLVEKVLQDLCPHYHNKLINILEKYCGR